jgi:hypothetical protein
MTLTGHRYVSPGLEGTWNGPITNALAAWDSTPNTVYITDYTPNELDDVHTHATPDGCWSDLGQQGCVFAGGLGQTWWLDYPGRNFVCPSEGVGLNCPEGRAGVTWWFAVDAMKEQGFQQFFQLNGITDPGQQAFRRQGTVAHELGHAIVLRHDHSFWYPAYNDGKCGPPGDPARVPGYLPRTVMDGDCLNTLLPDHSQFILNEPQPWDSCGVNHAYYDPNWGWSGC